MDVENVESTIKKGLAEFSEAELVITMAIGAAALLAGYRIKKIAFFIVWFIIGLNVTRFLMPWLTSLMPDFLGYPFWQNLFPVFGGLLLALMGFSIEKVCVGGIVFSLVMVIVIQYFGSEMQTIAIGAVIGVIVAGLAVMMMKPAIIIATSLAGAYAITIGVIQLAGLDQEKFYFLILLPTAAFGAITQFLTSRNA